MKFEFRFSSVAETDDDMSRNEAFDAAEQLANYIREKTGIILNVHDVDEVVE